MEYVWSVCRGVFVNKHITVWYITVYLLLIPKICQICVKEQKKVIMIIIKFFIGEYEAVPSPLGETVWKIDPLSQLEIIDNWTKISDCSVLLSVTIF